MKKQLFNTFFVLVIAFFLITSCVAIIVMQQQSGMETGSELLKLSGEMTFEEVVSTLGSEPSGIYSVNYNENETVYVWNYDTTESKITNASTDEQHKVYITFDAAGKVKKVVTPSGEKLEIQTFATTVNGINSAIFLK